MAEIKAVSDDPKTKRGPGPKSTTQYPYFDLDDSIAVARAVHDKGGGSCSRDQLAAFLTYKTTNSGAFQSRIYAAKTFGLVQFEGSTVSLTDRAHQILHPVLPTDEIAGRVEAFLAVPLFSKVYQSFKGGTLPAEVGLKNLFKTQYGIVDDRIKPAIRVLMDSAEQAGFFQASGNRTRMIVPVASGNSAPRNNPQPPPGGPPAEATQGETRPAHSGGDGGGGAPPGVHPAIVAILRELPRPGTEWTPAKKERFMKGFRGILDIVYPDPEDSP